MDTSPNLRATSPWPTQITFLDIGHLSGRGASTTKVQRMS